MASSNNDLRCQRSIIILVFVPHASSPGPVFLFSVPKSAQNREPYHSNSFGGIVGLRLFRIGRDLDILSRIRDVSHSTGTYILALLYKCRLAS
jgi:hypothetical protein